MPINVSRFTAAANAAPEARLRLSDNGQGVVAYGKSPKGRVVAWLKEAFGDGKAENREAIRAFHDAVRSKYGDRAGDAVAQQLQARYSEGRPLRKRHVEQAIGTVEEALAAQKEAVATQLADLGDAARNTPARAWIEELRAGGGLSDAEANGLLAPNSAARAQLEAEIKQAVLDAGRQIPDERLELPPALIATKRAVDEAAFRIAAPRRYRDKLESGKLLLGRDVRNFLQRALQNPVGCLVGMQQSDIPALNALITYTAEGYRLQNPFMREGEEAFMKALDSRPELSEQREALQAGPEPYDEKLDQLLEETKLTNHMVNSILGDMPPYEGTVYRGMGVDDINVFSVGRTFHDRAFASASTDRSFALQYVDQKKSFPVLQQIKSKTGRAIKDAVPGGDMGNEVLFKSNSTLKVTSEPTPQKRYGKTYWVVDLTEE
jgi:hypothetical protein